MLEGPFTTFTAHEKLTDATTAAKAAEQTRQEKTIQFERLKSSFKASNDCACKTYETYCSCLCHSLFVKHSKLEAFVIESIKEARDGPKLPEQLRAMTVEGSDAT